MSSSVLQGCYKAPRSLSNPRFAQTNETKRRHGNDGKLYHRYYGDEDLNYRTVSETDNVREQMRSFDMTNSLNMLNGTIDSRGGTSRRSNSASFVPPKLGTTSKSKKIEKRAWEKEMGLTQKEGGGTQQQGQEPETHSLTNDQKLMEAIATLQNKYEENLHVIEQLYLEKKQMAKKVEILEYKLQKSISPKRTRTPTVPPRYSSRSPEQIKSVGNQKLNKTTPHQPQSKPPAPQKPQPHPKPQPHQSQRQQRHRYSKESENPPYGDDEMNDDHSESRLYYTSPALLERFKNFAEESLVYEGDQSVPESREDNINSPSSPSSPSSPPPNKTISALQAADFFANEENEEEDDTHQVHTSRSAKSLPTRSGYEPSITRSTLPIRPNSAPKRERYSTSVSPTRGRSGSFGAHSAAASTVRSSSSRRSGPSPNIQADTDRYLQKQKFFHDEEEKKKQKEKDEEIKEKKRRQLAIQHGRAPEGMYSREERIRQKRLERQQKKQNKNEDEFLRSQQEYQREKLRNTRIRLSVDPSKTWEDMKREEEVERKDRLERRKQELLQQSHYSESLSKSVEKWKTLKSTEGGEIIPETTRSRGHVPSPEEVTANLKRQHEKWEMKMNQQKEFNQSHRKDLTPAQSAVELERRHQEYLERRKKKYDEKKELEETEKRKKDEEEKKRREKIINSQPPEGATRLTKAVEERVRAVKELTKKQQEEEEKEKKRQQKKTIRLQETSEFLKTIIKKKIPTDEERENELKRKIEEDRQKYKEKYKENQQKIQHKVSDCPTLIERFDQSVAIAAAGTAALNKVATAVQAATKFKNYGRNSGSGSGREQREGDGDGQGGEEDFEEFTKKLNWKKKAATDDIFNEEEKIQLGLRE